MRVSAVIVTRGDTDLSEIVEGEWPDNFDEIVVWDNSKETDFAVYGRYAAVERAANRVVYVQDDDVLLPRESKQWLVDTWVDQSPSLTVGWHQIGTNVPWEGVACNMPANFRHSFYQEHSLVGFGAVFLRELPARAFERFARFHDSEPIDLIERCQINDCFKRTCDIVFTALTPRVLCDVSYQDLPWASAPNRMWQQPTHRDERARMLKLALEARDG